MKLNKSTKRSLAFFLVVLCGVGFLNCKSKEPSQAEQDSIARAEQDSIARAEQREREFMQKRDAYIKEHGHVPSSEMKLGTTLLQKY